MTENRWVSMVCNRSETTHFNFEDDKKCRDPCAIYKT